MLFDHLGDQVSSGCRILACLPFVPGGLKKAPKLFAILSEHEISCLGGVGGMVPQVAGAAEGLGG